MKRIFVLLMLFFVFATSALSQEPTAEKTRTERPLSFYKVDYVLRELQDGKVLNTRNYTMTIEDGDRGSTKAGARVPVVTGGGDKSPQWQYIDIGINIDCRLVTKGDYVALNSTVDISSFALPEQAANTTGQSPVLRQARTNMAAVVPVNKQTVIGSIDDVNSTKRYEIAVTATKVR